ncbi:MAG TPA: alkaline phosphatase D family protein [Hyphomicrobiaceae bacterium]|nr:alkaline phosphatase D family protein [Hyphomicrobiaceae bacterium]
MGARQARGRGARSRREVMRDALAAAAAGLAAPFTGAVAAPSLAPKDAFRLGVASGDPTPDGVVLWTRLAVDLEDGARWGLSEEAYRLGWEVRDLETPGKPVVRQGTAIAAARNGYAVHVEVDGLRPGRAYAYRFTLGDDGAEGITRTAPPPGYMGTLRFAFCSCAEYENAFHYAYELMAREEPQFIVHLGDYIYEQTYDQYYRRDFPGRPPRAGCETLSGEPRRVRWLKYDRVGKLRELSQYRRRYAEYKLDPHLQYAHRHCPFIVTWDDHEVDNDYASDFAERREEHDFAERRIRAYRAYFENLPIRLSTLPVRNRRRRLYRDFDFGGLMRLYMLDERQYRSDQACTTRIRGGGRTLPLSACKEIEQPEDAQGRSREMLGREQEGWLARRLDASRAVWNVLAQGVMLTHIDSRADCQFPAIQAEPHVWTDSWGGYMVARQRIVDLLARHRAKNPVVLGGDIHAHFVNRVLQNWKDPQSPAVAPEFVCTALSSFVRNLEPLRQAGSGNERAIVDLDCRSNGYVVCDVSKESFDVAMMRVAPDARVATFAEAKAEASLKYRVSAGDPEPRKA